MPIRIGTGGKQHFGYIYRPGIERLRQDRLVTFVGYIWVGLGCKQYPNENGLACGNRDAQGRSTITHTRIRVGLALK
jgi:hypothetical protein